MLTFHLSSNYFSPWQQIQIQFTESILPLYTSIYFLYHQFDITCLVNYSNISLFATNWILKNSKKLTPIKMEKIEEIYVKIYKWPSHNISIGGKWLPKNHPEKKKTKSEESRGYTCIYLTFFTLYLSNILSLKSFYNKFLRIQFHANK